MKQNTKVLIDFEFSGLDNSYITDNEIVQMKFRYLGNDSNHDHTPRSYDFSSKKKIGAYGAILLQAVRYQTFKFTKERFLKWLSVPNFKTNVMPLTEQDLDNFEFYGFSPQQDILMLKKYGINIKITDIREWIQLSKHEVRLATEGSSLECCYYIVCEKFPNLQSHDGEAEIELMFELFLKASKLKKKKYLTVMPFGFAASMPILEYIQLHRRQADGYRWNNNDLLSRSITNAIEEYEAMEMEEYESGSNQNNNMPS